MTDSRLSQAMRWAQLTLTEQDPATFDLGFWLDYFERIGADAACLSAGGYIAYYPSKIPLHYVSSALGDTDPFGDLAEGCRKLGMVLLARTDPHAVHDDVFRAHPEWIAVDGDGNPRRHWAMPGAWVTCALGPYNRDFMTGVHREIVERYDVDGIFSNRWTGSGACYCDYCRGSFGEEIPSPDSPQWRDYLAWRQEQLLDICRLWDGAVRDIRPSARFIPNSGGGALSDLDMTRLAEVAETLFADRQARTGLTPMWANGKNGKEFRAVMGGKAIGGIFSTGIEERYRWKDSVQTEAEIRMWVADGIAHGLRPWFTKFSAEINDDRWLRVVQDIYQWHRRAEPYLRDGVPRARVGVVYSQQTAAMYGAQALARVEDHLLGMYHALVEAREPFEMVHDQLLTDLDRFAVLVLPNIAALSDDQCQRIADYVHQGGGLVATYETSRYTEAGAQRPDFGLGDLFGVRSAGGTTGPVQNSYLRINSEHAVTAGFAGAQRIIGGTNYVAVEPTSVDSPSPLTLVPSFPDLPMEEVYARSPKTDIAQLFLREHGAGRVAYFPWDIDRVFWEVLAADHGRLLANTVEWAAGDTERPLTVSGPGVLDVSLWQRPTSLTAHLVNLTNPMFMKGPVREIIPVGAQEVRISLPDKRSVSSVRLLCRVETPSHTVDNGELLVTVPAVGDHEVIAVDLDDHE